MFAWDSLTGALDELDAVRAQLREARGQSRASRQYDLVERSEVGQPATRVVATVIEIARGWAVVHWLHDQQEIWLCRSQSLLLTTLCAPNGPYQLVLVSAQEQLGPPAESQFDPGLTERQREIVRAVGLGLSNKEIGVRVGLSASRVKNSLTQIFVVLDVRDRTQLALIARDLDLGPDPLPEAVA